MSMRLRADDTGTKETWKANFKAIMENPGCCDEIWFSTGIGAPPLEWHRRCTLIKPGRCGALRS